VLSSRFSSAHQLLDKIAELTARLQLAESRESEALRENALLKAENASLKEQNKQLKGDCEELSQQVVSLREELRWYREQHYGPSSQKSSDLASQNPDQRLLFDDPTVIRIIVAAQTADRECTTTVAAHVRKHTGERRLIPEHFPRNIIPYDLPEDQRMCTECDVPHPMTRIGEETRECYRIRPAEISVDKHVRSKYACRKGNAGVVIAPAPLVILPKTNASPSLLSHLITRRWEYAMPLFRACRELQHSGLDLSTATACRWVNTVGAEDVVPVVDLLTNTLFAGSLIEIDETYLQVLKSVKAPTSDHFMVVRVGGLPSKRVILYSYIPSRTTAALKELLVGPGGPYHGKLLSDGLGHYDEICAALNLPHFGCWQHCRQYHFKAHKVTELGSSRSLANEALAGYIRPLFGVEDRIKERRAEGEVLTPEQVVHIRQEQSKPLLDQFKGWVDKLLPATAPKSALGKALAYTTSQWEKLERFVDYGDVPIHNNTAEQQNKHYAVGRKNWLFNHSEVGARASANLYSLVLTCRANDVVPFDYLEYLFEHLPSAKGNAAALEALLPWEAKPILQERRREQQEAARKKAEEEAARRKADQSIRKVA
jgi:transposase